MSDKQKVNVTLEETQEKSRFQKAREWFGSKIAGESLTPRMLDTWGRIHRVGGFLPIFVEGHLEFRSEKQQKVLDEIKKEMEGCETYEDLEKAMFKSNIKVFNLFHTSGSAWIGGLKDREKAKKVQAYLEFFQRCVDNRAHTWDIFTASMTMINISWKPEDVGRLPPYLIETKTVIQPKEELRPKADDAQTY